MTFYHRPGDNRATRKLPSPRMPAVIPLHHRFKDPIQAEGQSNILQGPTHGKRKQVAIRTIPGQVVKQLSILNIHCPSFIFNTQFS